jgi:hypothetical protein
MTSALTTADQSGSNNSKVVNSPNIEQDIPKEVSRLLRDYFLYFRVARTLHYIIGVLGLTCSLFATSGFGGNNAPRFWALGSGVCFGLIAFVDPNSKYQKFSHAARILNIACLRYQYDGLSKEKLFVAVENAENTVTELEKLEPSTVELLRTLKQQPDT